MQFLSRKYLALGLVYFLYMLSSGNCGLDPGVRESSTIRTLQSAVSIAAENIRLRQGWQAEDVKVAGLDLRDTRLGRGCMYDVRVGIGDSEMDLSLATDISEWEKLETALPSAKVSETQSSQEDEASSVLGSLQTSLGDARLPDFDVAGPVELWIQDADDMRLSVPHHVDAGVLKRVVIAEGTIVTVQGAKRASLMQPLQLPLPLAQTAATGESGNRLEDLERASGIMGLSARLKKAAKESERPVLSLRIIGPSSLVASNASPVDGSISKLRVRRLSPGAVELVRSKSGDDWEDNDLNREAEEAESAWPFAELSPSDPRLLGFEQALQTVLGNHAYKKGSFRLLKGVASPVTILHVPFELERKIPPLRLETSGSEGNHNHGEESMKTKLLEEAGRVERQTWEAVVQWEGQGFKPISVRQVAKVVPTLSISMADLLGNETAPQNFLLGAPPSATSLEPDWDGLE